MYSAEDVKMSARKRDQIYKEVIEKNLVSLVIYTHCNPGGLDMQFCKANIPIFNFNSAVL
jgi:hypothetical protein